MCLFFQHRGCHNHNYDRGWAPEAAHPLQYAMTSLTVLPTRSPQRSTIGPLSWDLVAHWSAILPALLRPTNGRFLLSCVTPPPVTTEATSIAMENKTKRP